MGFMKRVVKIAVYFRQRFSEDGCSYRSASLAYTTLLAIVPLGIISFGILSLFPYFKGVGKQIEQFVLANFVAESAAAVTKQFTFFMSNVHRLSVINVLFLAIVALMLMYNINRAFNAIWHAEKHFHFTLSFIVYSLVLLFSPIIVASFALLEPFIAQIPYIAAPLFFLIPPVLIFSIFTVMNWVLPSCRVRLLHAAIGGFISTVLFELAKYGFKVYLTHFPTYRLVYGALAAIPIFLIWLYVSWLTILLGALVANIMATGIPGKYLKCETTE